MDEYQLIAIGGATLAYLGREIYSDIKNKKRIKKSNDITKKLKKEKFSISEEN